MSKQTVQLEYVGPHDEVEVLLPDGRWSEPIPRGGAFSTSPEHASALLEQVENWKPKGKAAEALAASGEKAQDAAPPSEEV